jgi:tripeptidyl-peptidase-1
MHISNSEVHELVMPLSEHVHAVVSYLKEHGADWKIETENSDFISATVPVETAEAMLNTKFVTVTHKTGSAVQRAPSGYSLPANIAAAIDFVSPTVHIPGVHRPSHPYKNLQSTFSLNTPTNLRKLYSVGDAEGKASKNKQAVTAFLEQYYSESDLKSWWSRYCPKGKTCGKGLPTLVGDATTGNAGIEAMLDIETITGVAGNIDSEFWGFSGRSPGNRENEPFMKWLIKMSGTSDASVPKIFSTSYGEDEKSWSYEAAQRLNVEFMKAGARGISLLYASGDEGSNCKGGKFVAETPGSSPYVTAVGGTEPTSGFPSPGSESAIGLSSGGFSNYWATPDWQKSAVQGYLQQSGLPKASRGYNVSGRAYPDIAAQATNFCVNPGGCGVAGTSCASPTAAALFSLLNDVRLQNGKSTLGFLNPLIYANTDAFNDITTGSSEGCGFEGNGWPAKKGWDAVTGVGTPDYAKLVKVVSNLPPGPAPPPAPPSPPSPPTPPPAPPSPPAPTPTPPTPAPHAGDCLAQDSETNCEATTKGGKVCKWCFLSAIGIGICQNPADSCDGAKDNIVV